MKIIDLNFTIEVHKEHGQNLYKQNMLPLTRFTVTLMDMMSLSPRVISLKQDTFNQNWGPVSSDYTQNNIGICMVSVDYSVVETNQDTQLLNERENFFHKPLVNLNHFMTINEKTRLSSVLY